MPAPEPGPEWVLSGVNPRSDSATESELLKAARSAWPKALAHVRQVQSQNPFDDDGLLVAEVWESVLQSVSMTLDRMNGRRGEIGDLEAYLLGSFYHRLRPCSEEGTTPRGNDPSCVFQSRSWKFLARRVTRSSTTLKARFMLRRFLIGWTSGAAKSGLRASTAIPGSTLAAFWEFLAIASCFASDAA